MRTPVHCYTIISTVRVSQNEKGRSPTLDPEPMTELVSPPVTFTRTLVPGLRSLSGGNHRENSPLPPDGSMFSTLEYPLLNIVQ